jgi:hypothetical protein
VIRLSVHAASEKLRKIGKGFGRRFFKIGLRRVSSCSANSPPAS